jgi:hypothetical protein
MPEPAKRVMKRAPAKPSAPVSKRPAATPRAADPEYDYDERPTMGSGSNGGGPPDLDSDGAIRSGWGASQETIDSTSQYAQAFRPTKDTQIVKILEATPYASFRRHWIDRVGIGKRAYVCFQSVGKECPLCDIGDKPGAVTAFNLAVLSDDGVAQNKTWDCGVKLSQQLKTYHTDPKIGPLDKRELYFAVSMSEASQRQQKTTMVNPVRGRDLLEDWSTPPLDDAQLAKLKEKSYTAEIITMNTRRELEEVAAEMTGEDTSEKSWGS